MSEEEDQKTKKRRQPRGCFIDSTLTMGRELVVPPGNDRRTERDEGMEGVKRRRIAAKNESEEEGGTNGEWAEGRRRNGEWTTALDLTRPGGQGRIRITD
jgi:hypothetical protein